MNRIDIFITSYLRPQYTGETLRYLKERTVYPHRVWLLDNGGNEEHKDKVDFYIPFKENLGVHATWNIALGLAESEYFITSDNDIYVPELRYTHFNNIPTFEGESTDKIFADIADGQIFPCWLERMVKFMDERPDYAAISLHPHVFIGAAGIDPNDPEDVKERNMCGAVMRIMRKKAVFECGGWEKVVRASRNHEERTICSRLQTGGYKVGITTRIRAYHPFGGDKGNWGYPEEVTPEMQGHNPQLKDYVKSFDHPESYDNRTWLPL